ncbi:uncharacterized protein LOC136075965 [Hydra vulgaris]|uniref:Uncharacterized protein LOC136075964 n=1 Tax=Hydra vulgaris TaxID=6087 RepID=A0ABM4B9C9_HYDVU
MPNYRCCVAGCNNDSRYPDRLLKRGQVTGLKFHYFPKDSEKRHQWVNQVGKGLLNFTVSDNKVVCSNHFEFGKPTFASPIPTLYLNIRNAYKESPTKRRKLKKLDLIVESDSNSFSTSLAIESETCDKSIQCNEPIRGSMIFANLTRDSDVQFFTGLANSNIFEMLFSYLQRKGNIMHYWKGKKNTTKDLSSPRDLQTISLKSLTLQQEFLLVMMRLRLALLTEDLAHRFMISSSVVSSVFITWIKLFSLELKWIIHFPNRNIIKRNLPTMFRKYYPICSVIIDCSELFIETPSSLEIAAACWSNYKHHYTVKYLVGITPNGAVSFLSNCYGGRASDVFIVKDCRFLKYLQPGDQVIADRGFKIKDLLAFYQCNIAIPPSKHTNFQMTYNDVQETSKIANVRIYVEQAIGRMKNFRILKNEMPVTLLPLCDNIITVCAILTNFMPPLCIDKNKA